MHRDTLPNGPRRRTILAALFGSHPRHQGRRGLETLSPQKDGRMVAKYLRRHLQVAAAAICLAISGLHRYRRHVRKLVRSRCGGARPNEVANRQCMERLVSRSLLRSQFRPACRRRSADVVAVHGVDPAASQVGVPKSHLKARSRYISEARTAARCCLRVRVT